MPLPIGQNYQLVIKRIGKLPEFLSLPLSRHKDTPCPPHTEKVYVINQRKKINIKKIWNEHHPIFQTMVPIPKDVPSIGQIKRQTAEENLINHEEWFSWGKGEKRETMVIFPKKHRKNCECCPGHYLIVNHYDVIIQVWQFVSNSQLCH